MGAFCVYGVSMQNCIKTARKKIKNYTLDDFGDRIYMMEDNWNSQVLELVTRLLDSAEAKQISPAFDSPQFCLDWLEVGKSTKQITRQKIMCKGEKFDEKGAPIIKKGMPVIGWIPYQQR